MGVGLAGYLAFCIVFLVRLIFLEFPPLFPASFISLLLFCADTFSPVEALRSILVFLFSVSSRFPCLPAFCSSLLPFCLPFFPSLHCFLISFCASPLFVFLPSVFPCRLFGFLPVSHLLSLPFFLLCLLPSFLPSFLAVSFPLFLSVLALFVMNLSHSVYHPVGIC